LVATQHSRPAPDGGLSTEIAAVERLLDQAADFELRAPELALVLGERAAAVAESAGAERLWVNAEGLAVSARVRLGLRAPTVGRAVAALRTAEDTGDAALAVRLRTDLAVCARSVGAPLTGLAALRPVLEEPSITGARRAAVLSQLVGCLSQFGRKPELDRTLAEADRLCGSDDDLDGDGRLLARALLRVAVSAHRRRHGDVIGAADAARTGLGFFEQLEDRQHDGGVVRVRLVLQLVCSLLDRGDGKHALELARSVLDEPARAAAVAPTGWLRMAVATRVLLPSGSVEAAAQMLRDAVHATERHELHALTARLWTELAHVEERLGRFAEAIECLHLARAAEHVHARARRQAMGLLAGEFGAGAHAEIDLDRVLGAVPAGGGDASVAVAPLSVPEPKVPELREPSSATTAVADAPRPRDAVGATAPPTWSLAPAPADESGGSRSATARSGGRRRAEEVTAATLAEVAALAGGRRRATESQADTAGEAPGEVGRRGAEDVADAGVADRGDEGPAGTGRRRTEDVADAGVANRAGEVPAEVRRRQAEVVADAGVADRADEAPARTGRRRAEDVTTPEEAPTPVDDRGQGVSAADVVSAPRAGRRRADGGNAPTEAPAPGGGRRRAEDVSASPEAPAPRAGRRRAEDAVSVPKNAKVTPSTNDHSPADADDAAALGVARQRADEVAAEASGERRAAESAFTSEPDPVAERGSSESTTARRAEPRKTRHDAEHGSVAARSVLDRLGINTASGGRRRATDGDPGRPASVGRRRADDDTAAIAEQPSEDQRNQDTGAAPGTAETSERTGRENAGSAAARDTAESSERAEAAAGTGVAELSAWLRENTESAPTQDTGGSEPSTWLSEDAEPVSRVDDSGSAAETSTDEAPSPAPSVPVIDSWLPRLKLPPSLAPWDDSVDTVDTDTPPSTSTSETPFTNSPVLQDDDDLGEPFRSEPPDDDLPEDAGLADLLARALAEHQAGTASAAAIVKRLGSNQPSAEPRPVNGHSRNGIEPGSNGRHRGDT